MLSLASKIGYFIPIVSDEDQNPKPKPKTTQNPKSPKPKRFGIVRYLFMRDFLASKKF